MAENELKFRISVDDRGSIKSVGINFDDLKRGVKEVKNEVDNLNSDTINVANSLQIFDALQSSISQLESVFRNLTSAYQVQMVAETQLQTIMAQRMGATSAEIQSIKELCTAQQHLGVIGDEVQLSGAQQMATFLNEKASLEVLIPAMNNLVAQQNGLNATTQSAVSIGNMMGKAMQGQTEVLQRVGITFSEAQKEVLLYGDESQRAAMLAEVIRDNVGDMNAALAATDAGKQKQLENTMGDLKEQMGSFIQNAMPLVTIASQLVITITGVTRLYTAVKTLTAAFTLASIKSLLLATHQKIVAVAQNIMAASSYTAAAGTTALAVAVTALYAALTLGISVLITVLVSLFASMGDEAEETAEKVDIMKESTETFTRTSSDVRGALDMEIVALKNLIKSHADATQKVDDLNRKYGEAFGKYKTAEEWYKTLVENSKLYCKQIGYEAQAKVLATQIAAKELEKEQKEARLAYLDRDAWDTKGNIRKQYKFEVDGEKEFNSLKSSVTSLTTEIATLKGQYNTSITRMTEAGNDLQKISSRVSVNGKSIEITAMSYKELGDAIEENNTKLKKLAPSETAEANRLVDLNKKLSAQKAARGQELGLETAPKSPASHKEPEIQANPKTYKELGDAISFYTKELQNTNPSEVSIIKTLNDKINTYKEAQKAIGLMYDEASSPKELDSLEKIDAELQYQQRLRKQASAENIQQIDEEIKRLNSLRTKLEESSHTPISVEQITTYEQLEQEIGFYENKLKSATATERKEIQKQINVLKDLRQEWDDTLNAIRIPESIDKLTSIKELDNAISYYNELQSKSSSDEIVNIQRVVAELEGKRDALKRLTDIPSMESEIQDLDALGGKDLTMELKLIGIENIESKIRNLKKMLDDTKNPLDSNHRKEVKRLIGSYEDYNNILKKSNVHFQNLWSGVKGVGSGVDSITDALNGNGSAWEKITSIIDGVIQLYEGFNTVFQIIQTLSAVSGAHATVKGVEAASETYEAASNAASAATAITASAATTAALGMETGAWSALAAAKTFAAHAYIPFAGTGIAAGFVAAQQSLIWAAALPKFAKGGLAYGPTLGIFGEYAGAANNPEVVAPLDKLKSIIGNSTSGIDGKVEFRIQGRRLAGVLEREYKHIQRNH